MRLAPFHDGVDLALEHDRVIHRARAMHHRIGGALVGGVRGADRLERLAAVGAVTPLGVGRELDHAQDGAVLRRLEAHGPRGGVGMAIVVGGRAARLPQIGEREPRHRSHFLDVGGEAVGGDGRTTLGVVPGKDTTHTPDHAMASLAAIFLRAFTPDSGARRNSHSSLRKGLGMPSFAASAALFTFLYLATSEFFTAKTASPSR